MLRVVVFVCLCQSVYVLRGGGVNMCMHVSSVLVAMSVEVMNPATKHFDNLFFVLHLLCLPKLERFVF